jgi:hypothetical protein
MTEVPEIISREIAGFALPGATDENIIDGLLRIGVMVDKAALAQVRESYCNNAANGTEEFAGGLGIWLTQHFAGESMTAQVDQVRKDFYHEVELLTTRRAIEADTMKSLCTKACDDALAKLEKVEVNNRTISEKVTANMAEAADREQKITYYKSELAANILTGSESGIYKYRKLSRQAECLTMLRDLDPIREDYYSSQADMCVIAMNDTAENELTTIERSALGIVTPGASVWSRGAIAQPAQQAAQAFAARLREGLLGPRAPKAVKVTRTVSRQQAARAITEADVQAMADRANAQASGAAPIEEMTVSLGGQDTQVNVLRCREDQIADSILAARQSGQLARISGKPIIWMPPDEDEDMFALRIAGIEKLIEAEGIGSLDALSGPQGSMTILAFAQGEKGMKVGGITVGKPVVIHLDDDDMLNRLLIGAADTGNGAKSGFAGIMAGAKEKDRGIIYVDGYRFGYASTKNGTRVIRGNITDDEDYVLGGKD